MNSTNNVTQITASQKFRLKFIYSEKATKFCEIFTLLLTTVHTDKSKVKILQNFVVFSEYMNFMNKYCFNVYNNWHSAIGKGWGITQRRTSLWNPFTKKAFKGCQFWDLLFMEDPLQKWNNKICSPYKQKKHHFLVFYSFVHYKKYHEFQLPSKSQANFCKQTWVLYQLSISKIKRKTVKEQSFVLIDFVSLGEVVVETPTFPVCINSHVIFVNSNESW